MKTDDTLGTIGHNIGVLTNGIGGLKHKGRHNHSHLHPLELMQSMQDAAYAVVEELRLLMRNEREGIVTDRALKENV